MKYYIIWILQHKTGFIPNIILELLFTIIPITREIMDDKIKNDEYQECFDGYGPIKYWDVSQVSNFNKLLKNKYRFNEDISRWDVSSVTTMKETFCECYNLTCDLSQWDVSKVKNMDYTFYGCDSFGINLSGWNITSLESYNGAFEFCTNMHEGRLPNFLFKEIALNTEDNSTDFYENEMSDGEREFRMDMDDWRRSNRR